MEICLILEDCRSEVTGAIRTGLILYESCLLPALLYNAGTWLKIKRSDVERLNKLQNLFLNKLLGVFNCPIPLMHFDLAMTVMPLRLLKAKLLLYHHLATLSNNSLAKQILLIQDRLNLYSIRNEVQQFLAKHEAANITAFSKQKWRLFVNKRIASDT